MHAAESIVRGGWLAGHPIYAIASDTGLTVAGVMDTVRALGLPDRLPAGDLALIEPHRPVAPSVGAAGAE